MPEEKRKLNAWIPISLYSKLENAEYDNITQALIKALEKFFEDPKEDIEGHKQDIAGHKQDIEKLAAENTQLKEDITGSKKDLERTQSGYNQDITGYKENIKALNTEIDRLKSVIQEAPDPVELAEIKGSYTIMQRLLEEKDKRIEDLTREVERLDMFAHYFKNVEVKQIEPPANEKKSFLYRLKFW